MINWFEIPVSDYNRAKAFYESLFSIKMETLELGGAFKMGLFPTAKESDGGAICFHPDFYFPGNQGPLIYLNAGPSLSKLAANVERLGGKILIQPRQITEERGYMAVMQDTEGNRIALHAKVL